MQASLTDRLRWQLEHAREQLEITDDVDALTMHIAAQLYCSHPCMWAHRKAESAPKAAQIRKICSAFIVGAMAAGVTRVKLLIDKLTMVQIKNYRFNSSDLPDHRQLVTAS